MSIGSIQLDIGKSTLLSPEIEQERQAAVTDLLAENRFVVRDLPQGPYDLSLSVMEGRLHFRITPQSGGDDAESHLTIPLSPLKSLMKDYFLICESYYDALKSANCSRVEAIDMGRRGLHNEASEVLIGLLGERVETDQETARRLFTLICVMHLKQNVG